MGRVGAEALRFTRDEAAALLRAAGETDERAIDRVWERVDGWAAGLVLLHEHAAARGRADDAGTPGPPHAVFDYFAGEILNSAAPDTRRAAMGLRRNCPPQAQIRRDSHLHDLLSKSRAAQVSVVAL
jgi:ATP/maltotriose-dependent transcriptional regulator MalT